MWLWNTTDKFSWWSTIEHQLIKVWDSNVRIQRPDHLLSASTIFADGETNWLLNEHVFYFLFWLDINLNSIKHKLFIGGLSDIINEFRNADPYALVFLTYTHRYCYTSRFNCMYLKGSYIESRQMYTCESKSLRLYSHMLLFI